MNRVKIIHESKDNRFRGRYRNHEIDVEREEDGRFYISVKASSGGSVYDGWWDGSGKMEDAISEALKGSCLG